MLSTSVMIRYFILFFIESVKSLLVEMGTVKNIRLLQKQVQKDKETVRKVKNPPPKQLPPQPLSKKK